MSSESRQALSGDRDQSDQNAASKRLPNNQESEPSRLPFEPSHSRKKASKKGASAPASKPDNSPTKLAKLKENSQAAPAESFASIPEMISQRMVRRMAFFCGIPTGLGMLTFIASYIVVTQHIYKLPTIAVLLVSLGFFGLGVAGLSYGALSASWDEDRLGTWLGWSEFRINFRRTIDSWRAGRQKAS